MLGLGTIDQADPFQDSIRVCAWALAPVRPPTATQAEGLLHDTALKALSKVDDVSGLGTIDQADPFQDSIRVWGGVLYGGLASGVA